MCLGVLSNLFLDPDTGLRLKSMRGKRAPQFLFAGELVALARARPSYLTMVFDQSHPRGGTRQSLEGKLKYLAAAGISAFAYDSHACFIISSCQAEIIAEAHAHILTESRLPPSRLVVQLPSSQVCAGAA